MTFAKFTIRSALYSTASLVAAMMAPAAHAQEASEGAATEEAEFSDIIVTATRRDQAAQDIPLAVSVVGGEQIANSGVTDIRGLQQLAPSLKATTGQSSATGAVLSIRGIGTAGDNPGFEPAVGVFVDGVFRARAGVALAELPPLERVEVLRGPQGTLFGRNTSAGAISITTAKPKFELGGHAEASYGNLNEIELAAGITGPVAEQFAARLDGGYHKRDGYIVDANGGQDLNNTDRYFVRGQLLYDGDDITVRLIADMAKTDELCCGAVNTLSGLVVPLDSTNNVLARVATSQLNTIASNPALGGVAGRIGVPPYSPGSRTMAVTPGRSLTEEVDEWGVSAELNWDLGGATLTSVTAYRNWDARRGQDIDFSGIDRAYRSNFRTGLSDFTQEIRLQGSAFDGTLDWLVGGFYLKEELYLNPDIRLGTQANQYVDVVVNGFTRSAALPSGLQLHGTLGPAVPLFGQVALATNPALLAQALASPPLFALFNSPVPGNPAGSGQVDDRYKVSTDAIALFTHNIVNFSDKLSLTLGLRYNYEKKHIDSDLNSVAPTCGFYLNPANAPYVAALQGAGLLGAAFLLGCNPAINTEFNGVRSGRRSEKEFTGTAKLAWKLSDDVLVYGGYDRGYKSGGYNLGRDGFDTALLGGNGAQISDFEFGNETVDAFEVGVKTNFSREFQFNAAFFYQDFKGYQSLRFVGTSFAVLNFDKLVSKGVELESVIRPHRDFTVTLGYTYLDAKVTDPAAGVDNGRQAANQPKHTLIGALSWTPKITNSVGGLVHLDVRYQSDTNPINDPVGIPFTSNDGYGIANLRVGVDFADGKYAIQGYVENLFNTDYNITAFPIPEQGSSFAVYPSPPRFYGVKVLAKF